MALHRATYPYRVTLVSRKKPLAQTQAGNKKIKSPVYIYLSPTGSIIICQQLAASTIGNKQNGNNHVLKQGQPEPMRKLRLQMQFQLMVSLAQEIGMMR